MSAFGSDRALKRRLDLFGMPASERGQAWCRSGACPARSTDPAAGGGGRSRRSPGTPRPRRLVRSATAPGRAEGGIPRLHQSTFSQVESGARASVPAAPALSCTEGGIPRLRPPTISPVESREWSAGFGPGGSGVESSRGR
eukprot:scaffold14774_cov90-Isochrysis_galbana.AAC.1